MKKILLLLAFFVTYCSVIKADHVVGSDILYKCLGNGKYEITFKFYRDCNGCKVDGGGGGGTSENCPNPVLSVTGDNASCQGQTLVNSIPITRQSIKDITQLCGSAKSRCEYGTFPYGIEEHLYTGIVDLSTFIANGCCKFKVSTTIYVRSTTITTGAASAGFYTDATIDACNGICNNSPVYTSYPVAIICVGQDFVFNNGAIDTIDIGDSLSYRMAPAYQGAGSRVNYIGLFSPEKPMTFLGFPTAELTSPAGFHLDSLTGDLSFRPTKLNETGVVVVEVVEWRRINGVMTEIGRTRRDMQIIVINCPNNKVPKINGPYTANACAGEQVCMDIVTSDPDPTDSVKITWNRGIPRAVFTNNNGAARFASGSVCWTPTDADVSNIPYTFTITARDDACPLSGVAVRSFSIYVRESPKAELKHTKLVCGKVIMQATPFKNYSGLTYEWRVRDSLDRLYYAKAGKLTDTIQMKPGRNIVSITLRTSTPCIGIFQDTIDIAPYVVVALPKDTFLCAGNKMDVKSTTTYGQAPFKYSWNTSANDTGTTLTITPTRDTVLTIQVKDGENCINTDTIIIKFRPRPYVNLSPDTKRICNGESVDINAANDTFPSYRYLWNTGDTARAITVRDSNTYIITVRDTLGCTGKDSFFLYVNKVNISAGPDKAVCYNDTLKVVATGADTYKWYKVPGANQLSASATLQQVVTLPSDYRVWGNKTYKGVTCENADTMSMQINQLPVILYSPIAPKCEKGVPFNLSEGLQFPTPFTGTWSCLNNPKWVTNNFFYPDSVTVTAPNGVQTITVAYLLTDANGCKKQSTTTFNVIKLPTVNVRDSSICSDKGKVDLRQLVLPPTITTPGTWVWSSTNGSSNAAIENNGANAKFNLSTAPQGQVHALTLQVTNTSGCINQSTLNLTSRTVPVVDAGFIPPVCENDTLFNLITRANPYPPGGTWKSPDGGLINTNWFDPATVAAGVGHKLFYTYDIPGNNCPVTDSLSLQIKTKPALAVFSPTDTCSDAGVINLMNMVSPKGGTWTGPDVGIDGSFDAAQFTGNRVFKYDYVAPDGCKNNVVFSFNVQELPKVTLAPPDAACVGIPFNLKAEIENAGGVDWSTSGDGTFSNPSSLATVYEAKGIDTTSGTVDVTVTTTGNGVCPADSKVITISIFFIPSATIVAAPTEGCEPLEVTFEAQTDLPAGAKYEWNFGDAQSSDNTSTLISTSHLYQHNGTFAANLKVTSKDNCSRDASPVFITAHPKPHAAIDADKWVTSILQNTIHFKDITTIDNPGKIRDHLWAFGDPANSTSTETNPAFTYPTDSGLYYVTLKVISDKECEDTTGHYLMVMPQITVFIPNAFMPGTATMQPNNRFFVTSDGFKDFNITIFSRWGEVVYQSNKISEGWDGTYKGEPVQQDVYLYVVTITDQYGETYDFKGTITLLR